MDDLGNDLVVIFGVALAIALTSSHAPLLNDAIDDTFGAHRPTPTGCASRLTASNHFLLYVLFESSDTGVHGLG